MRVGRWSLALALGSLVAAAASGTEPAAESQAHWPQFRGVNACGVSQYEGRLPVEFGPENALGSTPLPPGHSSPCIWGDRIFLTAFDRDAGKLETLCLDRNRRRNPVASPRAGHDDREGPPDQHAGERHAGSGRPTGVRVLRLLWLVVLRLHRPRTVAVAAARAADAVRLGQFADRGGRICASKLRVSAQAGTAGHRPPLGTRGVATRECLPYLPGYATPVVWGHDGTQEVIVHSSVGVTAWRLPDGAEQWWVSMISAAASTPTVGGDRLFVGACWPGGEPEDRVPLPEFDRLLTKCDADGDGKIDKTGIARGSADRPPGRGRATSSARRSRWFARVHFFDTDGDERYDRAEWSRAVAFSQRGREHGLLAVRPGGQGDVTKSHVVWRESRSVAEVPSPLVYRGQVYMVKDGGIVSCLEAATGRLLYRTRLGPRGRLLCLAGGWRRQDLRGVATTE